METGEKLTTELQTKWVSFTKRNRAVDPIITFKEDVTVNKAELINAAAEKAALSKKDTEKALAAILDTITETLVAGDKVQLVGFGVFDVKSREARIGRNPRTKEEIQIPASKAPQFKAGKALKDAVSK